MIPTTTVWIEVKCKDRMPDKDAWYIIQTMTGKTIQAWYLSKLRRFDDDEERYLDYEVEWWLEEREDVYLLTKSQLEKFYDDAFDEGQEEANGDGGLSFEEYVEMKHLNQNSHAKIHRRIGVG